MMKVILCGGGNAIHVLSAYVGALPDCEVSILSLFPGEADRLNQAIPNEGIRCDNDLGPDIFGKPVSVVDQPNVVEGADLVIFALPSFTHELYLKALKPFLKKGVILGAMPGEGGFDILAQHVLGEDFVDGSSLFALETLPWACRILEYGKSVEVLGTKKEIDVVVKPKVGGSIDDTVDVLQKIVGRAPLLNPASNFLAVTLMNINSVWHPTISYGFYRRNKDWAEGFDEAPLFYQGADEYTGEKLDLVSKEVLELKRVLVEKYPGLNLDDVHHVRDWMLRSYGDDIGDKTNIYTMLNTNKGYRGLTHPMITKEMPNGKTKFYPNFKYRYFSEDIPCGLIVTRGIAELAGVPMPNMDDVIMWCQEVMGKEYLKDGKIAGKDIHSTRAPQHFGFTDLDKFMIANRYVAKA